MTIVDRSPDAMTNRARVYIVAGGARHLLIGLTLLILPWLYASGAFVPIFNLLPLAVWGWVMVIVGALCLLSAVARNASIARYGIAGSAVVTLVLAAGLSFGIADLWVAWANAIGGARVQDLFLSRPAEYPGYLRAISMIVPPSPFLPLVMLAVTVKDFAMCAQPLRVPLEERVGDLKPRTA